MPLHLTEGKLRPGEDGLAEARGQGRTCVRAHTQSSPLLYGGAGTVPLTGVEGLSDLPKVTEPGIKPRFHDTKGHVSSTSL